MKALYYLLFLLLTMNIGAQSLRRNIAEKLDKLPADTKTAVFIYDLTNKETLFSLNATDEMIPASNTKLFTSGAALYYFGPESYFSTEICVYDDSLEDGIINGDIILRGFGNPSVTSKDYDSVAIALKKNGITRINGNVIGDESWFDNIYTRDDWIKGERSNVSLPPVSALVTDRNMINMKFECGGRVSTTPEIEHFPPSENIIINNHSVISNKYSRLDIDQEFKGDSIIVDINGRVKRRKYARYYSVFTGSPAKFAALVFKSSLEKAGIEVTGHIGEGFSDGAYPYTEISISLPDLLVEVNSQSNNYYAECLFKSLGARYSGKQGNSFYAAQAVNTFILENDISDSNTVVVDGSGISRYNSVSVYSIVSLLEKVYENDLIFDCFYSSLAIPGKKGTLEKRFRKMESRKLFRGKTGTLNGVSALSGYLGNKDHMIAVSIIFEFKRKGGHYYKNIEEEIVELTAAKLLK